MHYYPAFAPFAVVVAEIFPPPSVLSIQVGNPIMESRVSAAIFPNSSVFRAKSKIRRLRSPSTLTLSRLVNASSAAGSKRGAPFSLRDDHPLSGMRNRQSPFAANSLSATVSAMSVPSSTLVRGCTRKASGMKSFRLARSWPLSRPAAFRPGSGSRTETPRVCRGDRERS